MNNRKTRLAKGARQPQGGRWRTVSWRYFVKTPWLRIRQEKVLLPSGEYLNDFLVVEGHAVVAILAHDGHGKVLLVKQYRHAVRDITHDLPGGGVQGAETPRQAARRELIEETGYPPRHLSHLITYYPDSGRKSGKKHIFLACVDHRQNPTVPRSDGVEHTTAIWVPISKLLEGFRRGEYREATLLLGVLYWLHLRHQCSG